MPVGDNNTRLTCALLHGVVEMDRWAIDDRGRRDKRLLIVEIIFFDAL